MFRTRVLAAIAVPVIALTILPVNASAAPTPAKKTAPTASVQVSPDGAIVEGERVVVRATAVARNKPVTINWGNGKSSQISTRCLPSTAKARPERCSGVRSVAFTTAGTYTIQVKQASKTLKTHTVTVTAPTPEPAPAPTPETTPTPTPTETSTPGTPSGWETEMLSQVNSLRTSVGVGTVTLCAPLSRAAQKHSEDMATNNYFSHTSQDGRNPGARVNAEGYIGGWGENIAAGYDNVTKVMTGWIDSPGHYANLVNPNFTHIGFGKAHNDSSTYGLYWTQNFGYRGTC